MTRVALLLAILLVVVLGYLRVIPPRTAFLIAALFGLGALLASLIVGGF
ncbi:hypothetical protein [Deinococcus cavernae]|nr:hypothetical protein [Deinococcus cavernae]